MRPPPNDESVPTTSSYRNQGESHDEEEEMDMELVGKSVTRENERSQEPLTRRGCSTCTKRVVERAGEILCDDCKKIYRLLCEAKRIIEGERASNELIKSEILLIKKS